MRPTSMSCFLDSSKGGVFIDGERREGFWELKVYGVKRFRLLPRGGDVGVAEQC